MASRSRSNQVSTTWDNCRWENRFGNIGRPSMNRYANGWVMGTAVAILLLASNRGDAQGDKWGTIKGQIVFGGDKIPPRKAIEVKQDPNHCLAANKTANLKDGTI